MNNHQRRDYQAPPNFDVDESYWAALLKDDDDRVSAAAVDMLERPTAAVRLNSGISPTTPVSSRTGVDHTASWADLRSIYERDETVLETIPITPCRWITVFGKCPLKHGCPFLHDNIVKKTK